NKTRRRTSLIGSAVAAHCVSRRLLRRAAGRPPRPRRRHVPRPRRSAASPSNGPRSLGPLLRSVCRGGCAHDRSEIAVGGASYGPAAERFRRRLRRGRNCPDRATPRLLRIMRRRHALGTSGH
uniref:Uncharacterized protein n=2 Tax=Ixodes scapularis TaxID=6945 RepID=A0A1S4L9H0_IXOSC